MQETLVREDQKTQEELRLVVISPWKLGLLLLVRLLFLKESMTTRGPHLLERKGREHESLMASMFQMAGWILKVMENPWVAQSHLHMSCKSRDMW